MLSVMITETHAVEAIAKPPSRLSAFGLSRTDWALVGLALFMAVLAVLTIFDLGDSDSVGVLARLLAPLGLAVVALRMVRAGNALVPVERRAWHAVATGIGVYAIAVTVRSIDGLRLVEFEQPLITALSIVAVLVFALGIYAIPRSSPIAHTRNRAVMDAIAGSSAVGALMWELVRDRFAVRSGLDAAVSTGAIVSYVVLVAAVVFAVMRHERYRSDRPFKVLVLAASGFVLSGVATQLGGRADFELSLIHI